MRRHVAGLSSISDSTLQIPSGRFLVAVQRVLFINGQKPYFSFAFKILEPEACAGRQIQTRLYCTERALWKLSWFLRDFGYDNELMQQELVDQKAVIGLQGIVQVSRVSVNGRAFTNVDAFAPAESWDKSNNSSPDEMLDQSA